MYVTKKMLTVNITTSYKEVISERFYPPIQLSKAGLVLSFHHYIDLIAFWGLPVQAWF